MAECDWHQKTYICVRPSQGNFEVIQLELGEENSLLVETLVKQFPNARGLYYYNPDNSLNEVPRFREKMFPPIYGDQVVYFTRLNRNCNTEDQVNDLKVEISLIENLTDEVGQLKDQLKLLEEKVKTSKATTKNSVNQLTEEIKDIRLEMKQEKATNLEETGLLRKELKTLRIKLDVEKDMSCTKNKMKQETVLRKDQIELEVGNLNKDLNETKKETANLKQKLIEFKINQNDQRNNMDKTSGLDDAPNIIPGGKRVITNPMLYSSYARVQVPMVSKEYFEKDDMVKIIERGPRDTAVKRMDTKSDIFTLCSLDNSDDEVQPHVECASKEAEYLVKDDMVKLTIIEKVQQHAVDKRMDTKSNTDRSEPECFLKDDAVKPIEKVKQNAFGERMNTQSNINSSNAEIQVEIVSKEPKCFLKEDSVKTIERVTLDTLVKRMDTSTIYDSDMFSSDSDPEYFEKDDLVKVIESGSLDTVVKRKDTKSNIFTLCSSDDSDDEVQPHVECVAKEPEYFVKDDMVKQKAIERVHQYAGPAGDKRMYTQSKLSNSSDDKVQVKSVSNAPEQFTETEEVDKSNIFNSDSNARVKDETVEGFKDHVCNTRCACMVGLDDNKKQSRKQERLKKSDNNGLGGKTDWIPMEERLLQETSSEELRSNETALPSYRAKLVKKAAVDQNISPRS